MNTRSVISASAAGIALSLIATGTAFAQTSGAQPSGGPGAWGGRGGGTHAQMPGVVGTVVSNDGTTLTVTSKGWGQSATPTTYTVSASGATVTKNGAASSLSDVAVGDTVMVTGTVSGTSVTATAIRDGVMQRPQGQGVGGTVASNDGTTLTVTSKGFGQNATPTTYTVTTSGATVTKNGASSSVGDIAVGDTVMVTGTVSGTSVTATAIRDGMPQGMPGKGVANSALSQLQGNGEPVIGGSVTANDGTTLTVAAKSGPTYTVDASSASVIKGNATSSLANVAVGDNVVVQGTVSGTSVTASSVIDQGVPKTTTNGSGPASGGFHGFLGAIGGFFQKLFGFF